MKKKKDHKKEGLFWKHCLNAKERGRLGRDPDLNASMYIRIFHSGTHVKNIKKKQQQNTWESEFIILSHIQPHIRDVHMSKQNI